MKQIIKDSIFEQYTVLTVEPGFAHVFLGVKVAISKTKLDVKLVSPADLIENGLNDCVLMIRRVTKAFKSIQVENPRTFLAHFGTREKLDRRTGAVRAVRLEIAFDGYRRWTTTKSVDAVGI